MAGAKTAARAAQLSEGVRHGVEIVREQVGVAVEGHRGARVTEHPLHGLGVRSAADGERRGRVTQVVRSDAGHQLRLGLTRSLGHCDGLLVLGPHALHRSGEPAGYGVPRSEVGTVFGGPEGGVSTLVLGCPLDSIVQEVAVEPPPPRVSTP